MSSSSSLVRSQLYIQQKRNAENNEFLTIFSPSLVVAEGNWKNINFPLSLKPQWRYIVPWIGKLMDEASRFSPVRLPALRWKQDLVNFKWWHYVKLHYVMITSEIFWHSVCVNQVKVKVTLRPTVSRPVRLGVRRSSGTGDQFFFLLEIFF
jgi:hypothetical protein